MPVSTNMVMPKIEREAVARNYGKFVISPLESGYGITIGNALRRVLLSSLEGAAVSSIRITDVPHEFSDIPGVREDVLQLMLNVKQIRLKLHDVDSARLRIEVQGEGVVTAADIAAPAEVEIINPELYLFTVDDDKAAPGDRDERRAGPRLLPLRRTRAAPDRRTADGCYLQSRGSRALRRRPGSSGTGHQFRPADDRNLDGWHPQA